MIATTARKRKRERHFLQKLHFCKEKQKEKIGNRREKKKEERKGKKKIEKERRKKRKERRTPPSFSG